MPKKRDTYRYELRKKRKLVYVGITNDPERREAEHRAEGNDFTSINVVRPPVTRESAERWEEQRLKTFLENQGRLPRYNKPSPDRRLSLGFSRQSNKLSRVT